MSRLATLALAALLCLPPLLPAWAQERPLSIDLARYRISISSGFTGTDMLLFGAVDQPGDVVAIVSSKPVAQSVVRKERILGLWLNHTQVEFSQVPVFYGIAASRPLDEIAPPQVLRDNRIGLENLGIQPATSELAPFLAGLIRAKQDLGLYSRDVGRVIFKDDRLFRASLHLPARLPVGAYTVTVMLLREGEIVDAATMPLDVRKTGISAGVTDFARNYSLLYGAFAIVFGIVAGWTGGYIFRRS